MKRTLLLLLSLGVASSAFAQSGYPLVPSGGGATIPSTSSILKGDGAGNGAAAGASDINSVINSTVAPVFANLSSKPNTAVGYGLTNGANIDTWGTKTAPSGTVIGSSDAQTLTNKHVSAPAIGSIAAGSALPSPTLLTVAGTDAMGIISITPSATGGTTGSICTVTFGATYGSAPNVALVAFNAAAGSNQTGAKGLTIGNRTATSFDILPGTTGLTSASNLQYVYIVSGP